MSERIVECTESEFKICTLAKMIREDKNYWPVGGGEPLYAVLLAKKLHAPNVAFVTEDGVVEPRPALPFPPFQAMASSNSAYRAVAWTDMSTVFFHAQLGLIDYALLHSLQIDQYGNINSSLIGGDFKNPKRRYGGAGGASGMASLCWGTILVTELEKRKFVKKMDFITSPGYLTGPGAREAAGLPPNSGPYRVITERALFGYDEISKRMQILATVWGVTVEDIMADMEFEPLVADHVAFMEPPTGEELLLLRTEVDIQGRIISQGRWMRFDLDNEKMEFIT